MRALRAPAFLLLTLAAGCASLASAPGERVGAAEAPGAPASTAAATPRPATRAPVAAAAPAPAAPTTAAARPAAAAEPGPQLDLPGLEKRLKETDAIGLFTKLSLKNSVDDLVEKFRAYHGGRQPPTLADLRPSYELLIMKVQSLIQKDDPTLADDVARSREVIWSVLADKRKFATI